MQEDQLSVVLIAERKLMWSKRFLQTFRCRISQVMYFWRKKAKSQATARWFTVSGTFTWQLKLSRFLLSLSRFKTSSRIYERQDVSLLILSMWWNRSTRMLVIHGDQEGCRTTTWDLVRMLSIECRGYLSCNSSQVQTYLAAWAKWGLVRLGRASSDKTGSLIGPSAQRVILPRTDSVEVVQLCTVRFVPTSARMVLLNNSRVKISWSYIFSVGLV